VLEIALHTIVASFTALTTALLYFDLKAREMTPQTSPGTQHALRVDPASESQP
jgi:hypothetical protein